MSIPPKMMAIIKTKHEKGAEYLKVDVPEILDDEVLVKVCAAAICGTDIHIYSWNQWAQDNFESAYSKIPRIMGHEFTGEIAKLGKNVKHLKVGQRIVCETHIPCGHCYQCRTGDTYNCQHVRRFRDGIYGEYAAVPAQNIVPIPDTMTYDQASVMEPFSVATHAASLVRMVGDTVCVVGAGPIGLFVIKVAKAMGAAHIYSSDVSKYRRKLAVEAGAEKVFNPIESDLVKEIKDLTEGLGCGTVFETSGNVEATKQGFQILRKCGNMVMIGLPSKPIVLDASDDIVWKAAKIFGVHGREIFTSWEISKNLIGSGVVNIDHLLTHRFPMSRYEEAFDLACAGNTGKVILYPDTIWKELNK